MSTHSKAPSLPASNEASKQTPGLQHLFFVALLDIISFSVLLPSYRDIYDSHGLNLTQQGYVSSATAIATFLMSPLLGRLSDTHGRVNDL
jgi:MFS family permease